MYIWLFCHICGFAWFKMATQLTNHWFRMKSGHLTSELSLTLKPHAQTYCVIQCKSLNNWPVQGYLLCCFLFIYSVKPPVSPSNCRRKKHDDKCGCNLFPNTTECNILWLSGLLIYDLCSTFSMFGCYGFQGVFKTVKDWIYDCLDYLKNVCKS